MESAHESSDEQDVSEGIEAEDDKTSVDSDEFLPKLKYARVVNHLRDILEKDAVSCVAVHPKFLCVGTVWGSVYVLDLLGYSVAPEKRSPNGTQVAQENRSSDGTQPVTSRAILSHSVAVNQISIDARGDYIASCSDDGKIYIYGLSSPENHRDINFGRLIRSISIDPVYYKPGSGRRFITGDERLTLHEKTMLSRLRSTVLADASHEGGVKSSRWAPAGDLIAWATLLGFRVYDIAAKASLGLIKWNKSTRVDERCHLCWKDRSTLLVGWADTVRVCSIVKRTPSQFTDGLELSSYILQPVFSFETGFTVCGVGPLEGGLVVVLGLGGSSSSSNSDASAERPIMHVIEPASNDYVDLCPEKLSLRGYQNYTSSNYSLECLVEENRYVIVSPKDIIVACPYDPDDHIDWLLDHGKFEEALTYVEREPEKMTRHAKLDVGRVYVDHLISLKKFTEAGALCQRVLGNDKKLWEIEIAKFAQEQQLRSVIDYLPIEESLRLSPHVYDFVLYEFLKFDPPGFLRLVQTWKPSIYNVTVIGNAIVHSLKPGGELPSGRLEPKNKALLVEALAILYSHEGKFDLALTTYMKIKNKGIFELIEKHKLHESMISILDDLLLLDEEKTFSTLVQNKDINVDAVVAKLRNNKRHLYQYLDALRERDLKRCEPYEGMLVELYADFCRERLQPLLVNGGHYSIQAALDVCRSRGFHIETALLLEKMGNTKEALQIMTTKLNNIEGAVDFCIKHDDIDLWEDVINYAKSNPENVKYLLNRIGNYINPIVLVKRIDKRQEIPGLKSSLVKMMQDYNLQVKFMEGCKQILVSDYFSLQEKLVSSRQHGHLISDNQICGKCGQKLSSKEDASKPPCDLLAFNCSHVFHSYCVPVELESCIVCTPQKAVMKKHFSIA